MRELWYSIHPSLHLKPSPINNIIALKFFSLFHLYAIRILSSTSCQLLVFSSITPPFFFLYEICLEILYTFTISVPDPAAIWDCYCRVYNLKRNPTTVTHYYTKMNSEADLPPCKYSPSLLRDTRVKATLVARPLLTLVSWKLCSSEHGVFTSRTVFILEHYFASKSFAVVREAFSNVYRDKKVPNKTSIHRLVTTYRNTGRVCLWQVLV
jgi:hypothetical protein